MYDELFHLDGRSYRTLNPAVFPTLGHVAVEVFFSSSRTSFAMTQLALELLSARVCVYVCECVHSEYFNVCNKANSRIFGPIKGAVKSFGLWCVLFDDSDAAVGSAHLHSFPNCMCLHLNWSTWDGVENTKCEQKKKKNHKN